MCEFVEILFVCNRLLHFHDVEVMDKAAAEEPIPVPMKETKVDKEHVVKKKKKKSRSDSEPPVLEPQVEVIVLKFCSCN